MHNLKFIDYDYAVYAANAALVSQAEVVHVCKLDHLASHWGIPGIWFSSVMVRRLQNMETSLPPAP